MADWSKGVEAFQGGADWRQRYRANKQIEQARDLALEGGNYDMEQRRALRRTRDPDTASVLGELDPSSVQDWGGQLQDPFATRLMDWFKTRKAKKQAKKQGARTAIPPGAGALAEGAGDMFQTGATPDPMFDSGGGEVGSITNPQDDSLDAPAQTFPMEDYADGGTVDMEKMNRLQERQARAELLKQRARQAASGAREGVKKADTALGKFTGRAAEGAGRVSKAASGLKRLGAAGALAGTALTTADTETEDYRKRFGMETDDPSLGGDIVARTLGAASDLGSILTFGAADRFYRDKQGGEEAPVEGPQDEEALFDNTTPEPMPYGGGSSSSSSRTSGGGSRTALPTAPREEPMDFSDVDIDPKEVPDMKTNDWVKYRAQVVDAARKSGKPEAIKEANDMVTEMQQKGFMNYGMQGFALQQAGNVRGAMAAYRAAFQYFPNGNDVEFGVHRGKDGRQQIIGVGLDEKTGKRVPGSEMVMDPERVTTLLENFKNPAAFRMWTKDWRDDQFREKKYNEVEKPMAQAQADYYADQGESAALRAEAAAAKTAGGVGNGANMRNAEHVFRERVVAMGMEDEATADFLASIMSQVKAANPNVPDNTIVQTIMTAQRDGTLAKRLQRMGIGRAPGGGSGGAAPAPRQALPVQQEMGDAEDPEMVGLTPEEREWANRPAQ